MVDVLEGRSASNVCYRVRLSKRLKICPAVLFLLLATSTSLSNLLKMKKGVVTQIMNEGQLKHKYGDVVHCCFLPRKRAGGDHGRAFPVVTIASVG